MRQRASFAARMMAFGFRTQTVRSLFALTTARASRRLGQDASSSIFAPSAGLGLCFVRRSDSKSKSCRRAHCVVRRARATKASRGRISLRMRDSRSGSATTSFELDADLRVGAGENRRLARVTRSACRFARRMTALQQTAVLSQDQRDLPPDDKKRACLRWPDRFPCPNKRIVRAGPAWPRQSRRQNGCREWMRP